MAGITNAQIMNFLQDTLYPQVSANKQAISELSTDVARHLGVYDERQKTIEKVVKVIEGNGERGIKSKVDTIWEERGNSTRLSIGVKEGIIILLISTIMGNLSSIIQWIETATK